MALFQKIKQRIRDGALREFVQEVKWLWQYIRRYRAAVLIHILLGVLGILMSLASSVASKFLIDAVTGYHTGTIGGAAAAMVGMMLGNIAMRSISSRVGAVLNVRIQNEVQAEVYGRILSTDWESVEHFRSGDLLNRLNSDAGAVSGSVTGFIPSFVASLVQFVGAFGIMLYYDPTMAVIALLGVPVSVICSRVMVGRMRRYNQQMKAIHSDVISFQEDSFQNLTSIKSFGITALNELQMLYNGKSLVEDGAFAIEVLEYINKRIIEFKEEDGNLYAIYGTPAENLCGLQVQQFRRKYGIVEGVSDREYVSNSFHCHVTEDITPIQKQDLENRFWNLSNGGKIQYVKYPIDYNIEAIKTLIHRAMDMGFYEGVNLSLAYCDDCGHQELEMDVCPVCGSSNLTKIDRMNGYLSYSRVHGDTRLNDAKMVEIAERKSM